MELIGEVEDFIYQNDSNSYTIAVFLTENKDIVTVVGYLPFVAIGDSLKLKGNMVIHQEYGEQFKIESFEKLMPKTKEAIEKYLSSGTIKGIGPVTARKIVDKFGDETINVLRYESDKLSAIKGITYEEVNSITTSNVSRLFDKQLMIW